MCCHIPAWARPLCSAGPPVPPVTGTLSRSSVASLSYRSSTTVKSLSSPRSATELCSSMRLRPDNISDFWDPFGLLSAPPWAQQQQTPCSQHPPQRREGLPHVAAPSDSQTPPRQARCPHEASRVRTPFVFQGPS